MELTGDGTTRSRREVNGAGELRYTRTGKERLTAVTLGRLMTRACSWDVGCRLSSLEPKTATAGSTARRRSWPRCLQRRQRNRTKEGSSSGGGARGKTAGTEP